jgi:hypothetical protein
MSNLDITKNGGSMIKFFSGFLAGIIVSAVGFGTIANLVAGSAGYVDKGIDAVKEQTREYVKSQEK